MTPDRVLVVAATAAVCVSSLASCTGMGVKPTAAHVQSATTDLQPIIDKAPYWCDFVPYVALSRITGLQAAKLTEAKDGWLRDQGLCLVRDTNENGALGIDWSQRDARMTTDLQARRYQQYRPAWLPKLLGYGFAVKSIDNISNRPYYVIAAFTCGRAQPWLSIDLRQVSPGRNFVQDLTALMRIAEQRFGTLHGCSPMPL